jgi:hypothetical protein
MHEPQALVSLKKYMPPPLPYFKVNICQFRMQMEIQRKPEVVVSVSLTEIFNKPHLLNILVQFV